MTVKHTLGPWLIEGNTIYSLMHHGWSKGIKLFKNRFSVQLSFDSSCSKEEIEATKQLIAAAPDLLDALKTIVEVIGNTEYGEIDRKLAVKDARAAIAKATYKEP